MIYSISIVGAGGSGIQSIGGVFAATSSVTHSLVSCAGYLAAVSSIGNPTR